MVNLIFMVYNNYEIEHRNLIIWLVKTYKQINKRINTISYLLSNTRLFILLAVSLKQTRFSLCMCEFINALITVVLKWRFR